MLPLVEVIDTFEPAVVVIFDTLTSSCPLRLAVPLPRLISEPPVATSIPPALDVTETAPVPVVVTLARVIAPCAFNVVLAAPDRNSDALPMVIAPFVEVTRIGAPVVETSLPAPTTTSPT